MDERADFTALTRAAVLAHERIFAPPVLILVVFEPACFGCATRGVLTVENVDCDELEAGLCPDCRLLYAVAL
jgi:hypothetical protein